MSSPQPRSSDQKKNIIMATSWLVLLVLITAYLLIDQPAPVQALIRWLASDDGTYSPRVLGGIVFIIVALLLSPVMLLIGKWFVREQPPESSSTFTDLPKQS